MPEPQVTTEPQQPPPEVTPPPPPASPPKETAVNGDGEAGKTVTLQHSAFSKIKTEAQSKGRQAALDEINQLAVDAGFESMSAAFKAIGDLKKTQQAKPLTQQPQERPNMPQPPTLKTPKPPTVDKAAIEAQRLADERQKMRKQYRTENRARRQITREKEALEAEMALRDELYASGMRDVDFGLHLLRREMKGKSVEELTKFDLAARKAFVEGVRKDRPYLFGETVAPATTGTNGTTPAAGTPAPPSAGQPTVDNAAAQTFDATKATQAEVDAYMRKLGVSPNL